MFQHWVNGAFLMHLVYARVCLGKDDGTEHCQAEEMTDVFRELASLSSTLWSVAWLAVLNGQSHQSWAGLLLSQPTWNPETRTFSEEVLSPWKSVHLGFLSPSALLSHLIARLSYLFVKSFFNSKILLCFQLNK